MALVILKVKCRGFSRVQVFLIALEGINGLDGGEDWSIRSIILDALESLSDFNGDEFCFVPVRSWIPVAKQPTCWLKMVSPLVWMLRVVGRMWDWFCACVCLPSCLILL